jgi:hypothetical protein
MNVLKNLALFFGLILLLLINLKCLKDEIDQSGSKSIDTEQQTETRSGNGGVIFYRTTLTTDNYLIVDNQQIFRTYNIFNKSKIVNIEFNASGEPDINVNGILLRHYKITLNFIDSTQHEIKAFSKSNGNQFDFVPNGENLLRDQHTAKFIEIENIGRQSSEPIYNFWRDNTINLNIWSIKKDGINTLAVRPLEPIDRSGNIFIPKHQH